MTDAGASVIGREHDWQDPPGLARVARILAAARERRIVVIDLPEDGLTGMIERSEIALLVRIIVGRECVEQFDLFANRRLIARRQGADARRLNEPAGDAHRRSAEIVQRCDFVRVSNFRGVCQLRCLRHCCLLWFRDVRFLRHQRNPTRGTWEAASPYGPTKPGAPVGGVTACTELAASRQASTDGAGLAAK